MGNFIDQFPVWQKILPDKLDKNLRIRINLDICEARIVWVKNSFKTLSYCITSHSEASLANLLGMSGIELYSNQIYYNNLFGEICKGFLWSL